MLQCRRGSGAVFGVVPGVVIAVAAVLLSGCGSSHRASPAPAGAARTPSASPSISSSVPPNRTTTRIFAPYDRSGAPTAGVVAHRSGSCFAKSITVATKGAYRCFAANTLLDPCFVTPTRAHVLTCYASPWAGAVQLRVATLPSAGPAAHVTRPWAIELAGGQRCVASNGTVPFVRDVALTYDCTDGAAGLRGGSAGPALSALYRASDGAVSMHIVVTAWRTAA